VPTTVTKRTTTTITEGTTKRIGGTITEVTTRRVSFSDRGAFQYNAFQSEAFQTDYIRIENNIHRITETVI